MGWFKSVSKRYTQYCETSDQHQEAELRTRYYKVTKDKAMTAVEEVFNNKQLYEIKSVSREHGEILLEAKKQAMTIVVTIVPIRSFENAIDFNASSEKWRLGGAYPELKREVTDAYNRLGKKLSTVEKVK